LSFLASNYFPRIYTHYAFLERGGRATLYFGIILCAVLFAIGAPIFTAFGLVGLILTLFYAGIPLSTIGAMLFDSVDVFVLLAVPLFVFAGNLMLYGKSSKYLIELFDSFIRQVPGGMAIVTVVACAFFAAISGSGTATVAAIGGVMLPIMVEKGYGEGLRTGVLAVSGTLGNLIPPSIFFVVYGLISETSIGELFMAGFLPGILCAALIGVIAAFISKRGGYTSQPAASWKERKDAIVKAIPAILMPLIVLGGIYGGVFTPTEAAAVSCIYGAFIGFFVYRGLSLANLMTAARGTVQVTCMLLLIAATAILLSKALIVAQFPQTLTNFVIEAKLGPMLYLGLFNILLIILGCFIEGTPMVFVCTPLLLPPALALGISPIHFGVLFCMDVLIGQITPPVGIVLYFTSGLATVPVQRVIRGALPFIGAMVVALCLVTFLPSIALFLPNLMRK
jgi:C4-dicarboxylate transporter DctM subunit